MGLHHRSLGQWGHDRKSLAVAREGVQASTAGTTELARRLDMIGPIVDDLRTGQRQLIAEQQQTNRLLAELLTEVRRSGPPGQGVV